MEKENRFEYRGWDVYLTFPQENLNGYWTWEAEGKEGYLADDEGGDLGDYETAVGTIKSWIDEVIEKKRIPFNLKGTPSQLTEEEEDLEKKNRENIAREVENGNPQVL